MTIPVERQEDAAPASFLTRYRWDLLVLVVGTIVVVLDQFTKALVLARFAGPHADDVIPAIGNIIVLEFVQNKGAAFSSFTRSPALLTVLILIALGVIAWLYWSTRARANFWLKLTFGLILGGAVGNLIDRFRLGYVVDFIHFQLPSIGYSFAVFNVADSGISVGIFALALLFWLLPKQEAIPEVAPPPDQPATMSAHSPTPAPEAHVPYSNVAEQSSIATRTRPHATTAPAYPSAHANGRPSIKKRKPR